MPEQATIQTNPPAAASPLRGWVAPSAERPRAAAEAQTGKRGHMARPLALGFAAVFASALQDNAKEPTPLSGDKPVVANTARGGAMDQPVNAIALALSGNIDGAPLLKTTAEPATPNGPLSAGPTAPREDRLKHPKQAPSQAALELSDAPAQGTVAAPITSLPMPPRQLTKQASPDFTATETLNDRTPVAAKAGQVPHEPPMAPSATGIRAGDSSDHLAKPSTLSQPVPMPSLETSDQIPQPLALSVPPGPNFSVGAPVPAARLQAPEPVSTTTTSPADEVAPAVIRLSSADGARHISLQLTPTDLGLVDIRIEQPKDGPVTITLTVQHPRTLDLLQRDLEQLSQTLDRAGLSTEGRQISLHLAPTHTPPAPTDPVAPASQPAAGGMQDQGSGQGTGPHANPDADTGRHSRSRGGPDFAMEGPQPEIALPPWAFVANKTEHRAGLNITA